ncbi:sigma-70 family RNA polymerase sigma factor [Phycicoccus sp. Soil748]|uniref:sigma-70 family RNA polymerase sigma factor n=1 Tax=Phycicoccus sp. Soil748 TaxID=1736397 RepID=UPI0007034201|nr:sigma-70 family RNA polymerase sigma factor [Phycicoccus sp. Soil748]KRE53844.1 hypothetical protein ASG70_12195 [Phycicoccus sp. Soil748]
MQREVDADFARYVRARQHQLLRAANLVCGNGPRAEEVLEQALATAAGRWHRMRDEPDLAVRRLLYRDAVSSRGGRVDAHGVLAALTPGHRALLVLRYFEERSEPQVAEVLGGTVPEVARETSAAVTRLHELYPAHDVTELLDDASGGVDEVDLAQRAWDAALAGRRLRRRRVASTVAGLAAVGVVVAVAQGAGRVGPVPAPSPTTTTSKPALQRLPDGTMYAAMPLEGEEDGLPDFDAGLPSAIDPEGRTVRLSTLSSPPGSVVAVYLRRAATHYRAVLVPADRTQVLVDTLDLLPTRDSGGNEGEPLGAKAISADGRYVVFAQPRAVVRLDLRTGAVDRYAVPAPDLLVAGWRAGSTVVARTAGEAWSLDLSQPSPTAARSAVPVALTRGVAVPVTDLAGETVTAGRWAASGAYFDQDVTSPVIVRGNGPIYQGLVAVDQDARAGRVLLAPESPDGRTGRVKECCTVLAWADPSTVLFRSSGYDGSWVLAWNVETGRVYDVTRLDEGGGVDYPHAVALAVGSRG